MIHDRVDDLNFLIFSRMIYTTRGCIAISFLGHVHHAECFLTIETKVLSRSCYENYPDEGSKLSLMGCMQILL